MDSIQEMYGADTKMKVVFTGGFECLEAVK
jgi:hypothetical protein